VYKSTDAGQTFKDISGNLPKVQATWPLVRNGQLIVGTAVGVYASRGKNGGKYAPLGSNLPNVPVYQISLKPGDSSTLVAATYGRGVYTYKFPSKAGGGGSKCVDRIKPRTRFSNAALQAAARGHGARKLRLSGSVTDRGCKGRKNRIKRTIVSVGRQTGTMCQNLKPNGGFTKRGSCHSFIYLPARHKGTKWSFTTKRKLPRGHYRLRVKSVDAAGNHEQLNKRTNSVRLTLR
ncbi:MAG: hypothetical protein QOC77_339, partial [Thermoleophilaceae bacterium]|nr:hypothetical protein [Thermoleophilaceae bacterium]